MKNISSCPEQYPEATCPIFDGLNHKDKITLALHKKEFVIKKGDFLFHEGDVPGGLICLVSGKAKIFKKGIGGREQIIKMVRQKELIGHSELFSGKCWPFSASAIEDSVISVFEKRPFLKVLRKNEVITHNLFKILSEEIEFTINRTLSLTQKHIRGRIADSLIILADTYGLEADGKTIVASLKREEIANLSNMTTSNAIRTLSNLSNEGIISMKGRRISILDKNKLYHISESG